MKQAHISLPTIHCESCTKLIGMTLKNISGTKNQSFDIEKRTLDIEFDDSATSAQAIVSAIIEDAGYEARLESEEDMSQNIPLDQGGSEEVWSSQIPPLTPPNLGGESSGSSIATFSVSGMHCSSCANLIERSLKHVAGVGEASVNFASEKARVKYDPKSVNIEVLRQAIQDAGYEASEIVAGGKNDEHEKRKREVKRWRNRVVASMLLSSPMAVFMMLEFIRFPQYEGYVMPYMALVSLILATPILFVIGREYFSGAWSALRMKTANMYSLIAIGTLTAYVYSLYSYTTYFLETGSIIGIAGMKVPGIYFEVAAFLVAFVSLGKYLEARAKGKTSEAIERLMDMAPKTARVKRDGSIMDIPVEQVQMGDIVLVRPGERVPVDGMIVEWHSSIDESMLTGESLPVEKSVGAKAYAGTLNKFGSFELRVTGIGSETALAHIIALIEEAQGSKAPIQGFADRVSAVFVPTVILIALATFAVWYFLLGATFATALLYFSAVIVIACPCALGLATPTAIMVSTGKWAEHGILIKWGEPLEMACQIDAIILDKTGTITEGKPKVTDMWVSEKLDIPVQNSASLFAVPDSTAHSGAHSSHESLRFWETPEVLDPKIRWTLGIAATLECKSEHPLAEAIVQKADESDVSTLEAENFQAIPGRWVRWVVDGKAYFLGTRLLMEENGITLIEKAAIEALESDGKTVMLFSDEKNILAYIAVADTIKSTSAEAIARMKRLGLEVYMVTGDNARTARAIASQVGIDHVLAEVLPENKALEVRKLQQAGKKVAMVGDGVNDAPALVQADLGIAMGSGADTAMESGGMVIMRNDLRDVLTSIELSRETVGKIRQNMFFALFYNVLGIPVAAGALATWGLILRPELAGLAMALSSVSVVTNSLLLKNFRPGSRNILSLVAPVVMTVFFLGVFWQFSQFGETASAGSAYALKNPWLLSEIKSLMVTSKAKIGFDARGLPKVFFGSDRLPTGLEATSGIVDISGNNMVVGYSEAQMMIREGLIRWAGDELPDFFGAGKIRVAGILKPTGTFLDDAHILSTANHAKLIFGEDLLVVMAPKEEMKYFHLLDGENTPPLLSGVIHAEEESRTVSGKTFLPVYVGYDEARMMQNEKLFGRIGDTIAGLFGNDIVIAGLPKKTFTSLDMMHFVPKKFRENYLRYKN